MADDGYEMTDVSKTRGDWKIADLRKNGVTPNTIISILAESCLTDTSGDWKVSNIKSRPALPEWARKEVYPRRDTD
jgi:hypothetical protein